jgi:hypothetical protein
MNKYIVKLAIITRFLITIVVAFTGGAIAQSIDKRAEAGPATPNANGQIVDARQSGAWSVGIDPARNTVQLTSSTADPLPVQVIGSGSARQPFQSRVIVEPSGLGFATGALAIPAGKRLVIENISAIARHPAGIKMEINFFTYLDNGDGVGDISDLSFHRIALTDQGTFNGTAIDAANHKVLVFADEKIGTTHYQVVVQARLNASTTEFAQGQVTFSGYIEDLPPGQ